MIKIILPFFILLNGCSINNSYLISENKNKEIQLINSVVLKEPLFLLKQKSNRGINIYSKLKFNQKNSSKFLFDIFSEKYQNLKYPVISTYEDFYYFIDSLGVENTFDKNNLIKNFMLVNSVNIILNSYTEEGLFIDNSNEELITQFEDFFMKIFSLSVEEKNMDLHEFNKLNKDYIFLSKKYKNIQKPVFIDKDISEYFQENLRLAIFYSLMIIKEKNYPLSKNAILWISKNHEKTDFDSFKILFNKYNIFLNSK